MYWGSVRFFKNLILLCVIVMIAVPTGVAIGLGKENTNYRQLIEQYQAELAQQELKLQETQGAGYIVSPQYRQLFSGASLEYQLEYPELYVESGTFTEEEGGKPVIYLTFDDGPSENTERVLDILKENNIKATFFVVNNNIESQQHLYKRIADEGHTLGIHTYSHQYQKIYSSVEEYLADFNRIYEKVYSLTGVKPTVFRFPGGSINNYNQHIYFELIAEMLRRGFTYYDWNVSSGDAGETYTSGAIYNAVVNGVGSKSKSIVLMHDSSTKNATVKALPEIIAFFSETHEFRALDNSVKPASFTYKDNNISN